MLRQFVEEKHYKFSPEAENWEDAIRQSCECLEADGTVEENYKEDIIECVKKYGPYIVIMPNVAMPHSQEGATGVNKTAIAFLKLDKPVNFGNGEPDLDAQLFFTLASENHDKHLENMSKLSEMLMNEMVLQALTQAQSADDLLSIQEKYLDE